MKERLTRAGGYLVEGILWAAAALIVAGHVVNRLTSPRPLHPLWNRISSFAVSRYGGGYVAAGIVLFALGLLVFGVMVCARHGERVLARVAGGLVTVSALPMALIAEFPIFPPREERDPGYVISAATRISMQRHYEVSGIAFAMVLAGILLLSITFLDRAGFRRLGQAGIVLVPIAMMLLVLTYERGLYSGTWQRCAFLLAFGWVALVARRTYGVPGSRRID